MLDLLLGLILGLTIGLIPGGNPVLCTWTGLALGLPASSLVVGTIICFPLSDLKLYDTKVSGDIAGLMTNSIEVEGAIIRKLINQRMRYFSISFALSSFSIILTSVFLFPILGAWVGKGIILMGMIAFVIGKDRVRDEQYGTVIRQVLIRLLIMGVGSVCLFTLAKRMEIANPVYLASVSLFFPWERLIRFPFLASRPTESDLEKEYRNIDLFIVTPFLSMIPGWNASISAFFIPNEKPYKGRKELTENNYNPEKKLLLNEAVSEGFRLGLAFLIPTLDIGDIGGYSSIMEPLRSAGFNPNLYTTLIPFSIFIGVIATLILNQFNWEGFYRNTMSQWISYGTLFGTIFGNAGLFTFPFIGIGLIVSLSLKRLDQTNPSLYFIDPNLNKRIRSTLFIYPILFL